MQLNVVGQCSELATARLVHREVATSIGLGRGYLSKEAGLRCRLVKELFRSEG